MIELTYREIDGLLYLEIDNIVMVIALEDETSMESHDAKLKELQQELLKRANARQD